jgi:hypothetical protein
MTRGLAAISQGDDEGSKGGGDRGVQVGCFDGDDDDDDDDDSSVRAVVGGWWVGEVEVDPK